MNTKKMSVKLMAMWISMYLTAGIIALLFEFGPLKGMSLTVPKIIYILEVIGVLAALALIPLALRGFKKMAQKRQMLEEFAQRIRSQGLNFSQYMQFTGMTAEKMMEQVAPQAMDRIQSRLVLEAVAKAEGLTATDEDFDKKVAELAESYKMEKDKVVEMIGEEGKKQMLEDIAVSKAVDFVTENAKEGK